MSQVADAKTSVATQIHEIYIKATPQAIWDAITTPEWTAKYGYRGLADYDLRPGGAFKGRTQPEWIKMGLPEIAVDGEVIESDPPRRLVQTYRFLFSDAHKAEGFTRLTWEIEPTQSGFSRLTVTHELEGAPIMAGMVAGKFSEMGAGGWAWILSDLKTVLETGTAMSA
jgi:uncharacterized protein YndB with AHSA1/START domain